MNKDFIYDIETYRNLFSCAVVHVETGTRWIYEVSPRRDQSRQFFEMLLWIRDMKGRLVGYNNEGFDWPVCEHLIKIFRADGMFTANDAYEKAQSIIGGNDKFAHTVWPSDRTVVQVDLYKIHHFDNMAKATSLKKLEINMRSAKVIDLPYSPHELLSSEQMDHLITYMCHDVSETLKFYKYSLDQIRFRDELAEKYPDLGDVINFNDTKIGKKFFERELERAVPGSCYQRVNGRKTPRQTQRSQIRMADVISPRVSFYHPSFNRVKDWLSNQVLSRSEIENALSDKVETKGVFKGLTADIDGFEFVFGTGGIHGSLTSTSVFADDDHDLIDIDAVSYYPKLAITNRWFPEHLSEQFCDIYADVFKMRQQYGKKTAENAMLKLALNGVYGDSNNVYSPFYDPQYTMSITVNGQLYLCMLAECLLYDWTTGERKPGLTIIQANTDGLTFKVRKDQRPEFERVCEVWEMHTGLTLESVDYRSMHIRDVNSYMAVKKSDGSVKRIGAYAYENPMENPFTRELSWHKDHSMRVVAMAAEAFTVHGVPIADFIMNHRDPFDFMLSIKVPKSSRLEHGDQIVQNVCRYYVSTTGAALTKIMPPLKNEGVERVFAVQKGWTVSLTNDVAHFEWGNVNWLYYIEEATKLTVKR